MTRFANSLMSSDIMQRIIASPRTVLAVLCGVLVLIIAGLYTKEFFVVLSGLAGTAAGYLVHRLQENDNPISALRSVFNMRRINSVTLGSGLSALIALILFWEGIAASPERAVMSAIFTSGAYAFFAYSLSSYVFGRQAISQAKRKLAKASVEQTHIWHTRARAARKNTILGDA